MDLQLFGGGLDSVALFYFLLSQSSNFKILHVDYGQKAVIGEKQSTKYFSTKYGIEPLWITISNLEGYITGTSILKGGPESLGNSKGMTEMNRLENRNSVLLSIAVMLVASNGGGRIFVAFHREPEDAPFPDATKGFLTTFKHSVSTSTRARIEVRAPFQETNWTRDRIFDYGYRKGGKEFLDMSFTCYESVTTEECGVCAHCILKKLFMDRRGV
jgi:7-cyano-7-deazaguanine synthase in queuosine biosynthesis